MYRTIFKTIHSILIKYKTVIDSDAAQGFTFPSTHQFSENKNLFSHKIKIIKWLFETKLRIHNPQNNDLLLMVWKIKNHFKPNKKTNNPISKQDAKSEGERECERRHKTCALWKSVYRKRVLSMVVVLKSLVFYLNSLRLSVVTNHKYTYEYMRPTSWTVHQRLSLNFVKFFSSFSRWFCVDRAHMCL